jgi:hypothetical protein
MWLLATANSSSKHRTTVHQLPIWENTATGTYNKLSSYVISPLLLFLYIYWSIRNDWTSLEIPVISRLRIMTCDSSDS